MDNQKEQIKFEQANKALEEKRVSDFCAQLIDLEKDLTCNCFFRDQEESIYENQLVIIEQIEDNAADFDLNLTKGFVYSKNKKHSEAYRYLTNAIAINNKIDLPYTLRAFVEPEINPNYIEDAKRAVLLNPSARNYFFLAKTFGDIEGEKMDAKKAVNYYSKVIQLKPDFACAYNNRANLYSDLLDYKNAILDYKKCIELNETHWAYLPLWLYLDKEGRLQESLKYAKLGAKMHPNNFKYQLCIGITNERLCRYEAAMYHYQIYLNAHPENTEVANGLKNMKEILAPQKPKGSSFGLN